MLTRSGARAFFLGGTVICSVVFIALTVDTFAKMPALTHAERITPAVARGKDLWDHNNCMGCHTLFGEGAYYAPELTRVVARRGPEFIRALLRDPEKMYPGQRKMKKYDFSEPEIDDLVAFFSWAGEVDLQGFPPQPQLMPVAVAQGGVSLASGNRPQIFNQLCVACHSLGGQGGNVGPALDDVGRRLDSVALTRWLHDPAAVKPGTKMPKLPLSDAQIDELAAFLTHQNPGASP